MQLGFNLVARAACTVAALLAVSGGVARAVIVGPYSADANTLHLYHLDESASPAADFGTAATLRPLDSTTNYPTLGVSSVSGFGTAATFTADAQEAKNATATSQSEWQGANGAFTYEAMINVSTSLSTNPVRTILSRDHTTGGPNQRSFIFRLNGSNIDFINTGAPAVQTLSIAYPTSGADAFSLNTWFHIAVTYNGADNTAGNLSFYWTKVDPTRTAANLLGVAQLTVDVGNTVGNSPFDVGNRDAVAAANNNFRGLIDEVRVSDIARGAGQFIFAVPEASSFLAVGCATTLGLFGMLVARRRRGSAAEAQTA